MIRFTLIMLLTSLVFLVLKLAGPIEHWSWGYVLLPTTWWLGAAFREVEIETAVGRKLNVDL